MTGGIVGVIRFDGPPLDASASVGAPLELMIARMAHRFGSGVHRVVLDSVAVAAVEPVSWPGHAGLAIAADLRLDNRDELRATLRDGLRSDPHEVGPSVDIELVLAAYARWGAACVEHLVGAFAFAIRDEARQQLFCARDHLGVKPFYYYSDGRRLLFASEIKAILAVPDVPRRLREARVADYLAALEEDTVGTFYEGILRLPPAHVLQVDERGGRTQRFWRLEPRDAIAATASLAGNAARFRALLDQAVRCRIEGSATIGSQLSGGLDSSSIVCLASRASTAPLHTFSAIYPTVPVSDESQAIHAILGRCHATAHFVEADRLAPLSDLERAHFHLEEPRAAPLSFVQWAILGAAQQAGMPFLLEGFDGDTTVSHGHTRLADLAGSGRVIELVREAWAVSRRMGGPRAWEGLWHSGLRPWVPWPLRAAARLARRRDPWSGEKEHYIRSDFASRVGLPDRLRATMIANAHALRCESRRHVRLLTYGVIAASLETANKGGAAFGLEYRYPYLDRRLVEFCVSVPGEHKLAGGWVRLIQRKAMEGLIPPEVQWRPTKVTPAGAFLNAMVAHERQTIEDVLRDAPSCLGGYIEIKSLRDNWRRFLLQGNARDAMRVWRALTLALWLKDAKFVA